MTRRNKSGTRRKATQGQSSENEDEDDELENDDSDDATGGGNDQDDADDEDENDGDSDEDDDSEDEDDDEEDDKARKLPKSQAALDALIQDRLDRQERNLRAKIKQELKDEAEEAEAKNSKDFEKLYNASQKRLKDVETERDEYKRRLNGRDQEQLRKDVAREVGIPANAVSRIQGETRSQMRKDAKALKKLLGDEEDSRRDADDRSDAGRTSTARPQRRDGKSGEKKPYEDASYWIRKN